MYAGEGGNLTLVLKKMTEMRNEHVHNSNWNTRAQSIWDFFNNLSWKKVLQMVGMVIGTLLLIVVLVTCCVIPLIRLMIRRMAGVITGQFSLQIYDGMDSAIVSSPNDCGQSVTSLSFESTAQTLDNDYIEMDTSAQKYKVYNILP